MGKKEIKIKTLTQMFGASDPHLLENLKGEKNPDVSLAAHPKVFTGCSVSGDFAILEAISEKQGINSIKN